MAKYEVKLLSGAQVISAGIEPALYKGEDGREIELQMTQARQLQWRYAGDEAWQDLYSFASLYGDEAARAAAELAREAAEAAREAAEGGRATAEAARAAQESDRADAEATRAAAETGREAAEAARGAAEGGRVTAEDTRATAEAARVTAETARTTAEAARVAAETKRQTDAAAAIQGAQVATAEAQAGAERAEAAADRVNDALAGIAPAAHAATHAAGGSDPITPASIGAAAAGDVATALDAKLDARLKGAASGLAELDDGGKVPSAQLPSYVDDVLEYDGVSAFPVPGESGKIYVAIDANLTYRWSGSDYVMISSSLALGETQATAYRGDRGKIAYDHSQAVQRHVPAGGAAGKILRWSADGAAAWGDDADTTYGPAGAELGLIKSGGDLAIAEGVATVLDDSHNHVIANVDGLQAALEAKAATADLTAHAASQLNPHAVTAAQVHARPDDWMPTFEETISDTADVDGTFYRGDAAPTGTTALKYSGYFEATRVTGAYYSDVAECFDVRGPAEPGDVIALDLDNPGRFARCDADASPLVVGVVSDAYFLCIGRAAEGVNVPIGLVGKLAVKVIGPCAAGDLLVSAEDGAARALRPGERPLPGAVLGMALDGKPEAEIRRVRMLIWKR